MDKTVKAAGAAQPASKVFVYAVCTALAAALVYLNTLVCGFVYDDLVLVVDNPWIRNFDSLPLVFTKGAWAYFKAGGNYYRPMMHVIYTLDYALLGPAPWGFHLTSLLFHCGVSVMAFLTCLELLDRLTANDRRVNMTASFLAALVFALHPIHTEAVTWVASLPEVSFSFFYLLSFYLFMKSSDQGAARRGIYVLSVLSFALSTLCKEPALTLPLVLTAYVLLQGRRRAAWARVLPMLAPYFLVAVAYMAFRFYALGGFAPASINRGLTGFQTFINVFPLLAGYVLKLFVPSGLNVFHTFNPARSVLDAAVLAGLLITAGMALAVFSQASRRPAVSFSLLLFIIPLLPALYIPGVGENVFAERYLYLPSLGAALLLAWLAAAAVTPRPGLLPVLIAAFLVVAVVFSAGTVARNRVYKDDYTLWTDSVRKSPDAATPRYGLGYTLYAMGRTKEAIVELQQAVRLRDDVPKFHENLGNAYYRNGETDKAIEEYKAALALDPSNPLTWNRLGVAYGRAGRIPEAIRQFERALEIDPSCDSAYYNLGLALKTTR